ncbi:MAG: nucleotide sugar dehydrogenase [Acidobacteriota bacterium]
MHMSQPIEQLRQRIADRTAKVAVVGMGYVGLPLAMEVVRAGFDVLGIDVDARKVEGLNAGRSHVLDVPDEAVRRARESGKFAAYADYEPVREADCVSICVPTPLKKTRDPDISYVTQAVEGILPRLHPGMLVVLESTTYPGTTEELIRTEVERAGYRVGEDVCIAFSPERVDPGNKVYNTRNTPKVIGGCTPACTETAKFFYEQVIEKVVPVSSTQAAEMVKLLENTFRVVNIGLVNEVAVMCDKLGISVWEVIEAASTKPFGFMPFYPGPGLGGHCIPIDPLYLSWKMKSLNYNARFIELASEINTEMPEYCVGRIVKILNQRRKAVNGSKILVLGVAYKRDVSDTRESPAIDIIRLLEADGAEVDYHDPHVPELVMDHASGRETKRSVPLTSEAVSAYDLVVLTTDHSAVDYPMVQAHAQVIFDTRNAYRGEYPNVVKL